LATVCDATGNWQIRVVPNKYPAVAPDAPLVDATGHPLLPVDRARGVHEVVIESPQHVHDWLDLPQSAVAGVLAMLAERLRVAFGQYNLVAGQVFKNVGKGAGASLEHVHSQLLALPFVPAGLEAKLHLAARHFQAEQECLYCHLCREELAHGDRLVCQNSQFVAACAFAGRQPYETWIMPQKHLSQFSDLQAGGLATALAEILQEVLRRLAAVIQPLAYNLVLHTAPARDPRSEAFHWHWEVIPRTASLAGFEWGIGVYINSLSPERAAGRLRG
jgi:UDPglucose--hexose-1-phosphate uridylyltransferase